MTPQAVIVSTSKVEKEAALKTPKHVEFGGGIKAMAQKKRYSNAEAVIYTFSQGGRKREIKKFDLMKMLDHPNAAQAQITYFSESDVESK